MKKLAVITTHPIQYYAPIFSLLQQRGYINIKVFYTCGQVAMQKTDPGFGKQIDWDIPLLQGYEYEWVTNISPDPGTHHFKGIINPGLIDQIKAFGADAIWLFGWSYQSHLKVMRYFAGKVPVYFRGDSTLLDDKRGLKSFLRTIWLRWVYEHVDHAFYVGSANKKYFLKYGLKERQLSFAPHAIDNERFARSRSDDAKQLRKRLGVGYDQLLILFAGKLEEKKSPEVLLEAFLQIDTLNKHLLFVGNGKVEQTLKRQAKVQNNIHFVDFVNQAGMPVVYQACDLFCLPSKGPGETWGLAVNEAMACGKAVLVSEKCGCAADLIIDGYNGAVVKADDVDELAAKLSLLTRSKDLLAAYGKNSADRITEWNFANIAEAIEDKLSE